MFKWLWDILSYIGLFKKTGKFLFLGLDAAGKTTLLKFLQNGKIGSFSPTQHSNSETVTIGYSEVTAIDLGGHEIARKLWKDFYTFDLDGIVFIIDSADEKRFGEAKKELLGLMDEEKMFKVPILILGNKIDKKKACSEKELVEFLGIGSELTGKKNKEPRTRPMEVFMCSILDGFGYGEGLEWLSGFIK